MSACRLRRGISPWQRARPLPSAQRRPLRGERNAELPPRRCGLAVPAVVAGACWRPRSPGVPPPRLPRDPADEGPWATGRPVRLLGQLPRFRASVVSAVPSTLITHHRRDVPWVGTFSGGGSLAASVLTRVTFE